jgi:uncharacterized protein (TIGR02300 family)
MSKPARGTKRVCPSCGARFYDLGRSPITCPVCQAVYQMTAPTARRSERAAPAEARKPEVADTEDEPVVAGGAEVISLDEAEEAEEAAVDDEEIVDIGGDEDIPAGDDDDNTFLEEEEEGDDDMSDIVKSGPKEES